MLAATALGFPVVLVPICIVSMVVFYLKNNYKVSEAFFVALLSMGVNSFLKLFIHRTRPDTLYVGAMRFKTYSFPSGHSFGAMVLYGLITYLLYNYLPQPWNIVAVVVGILIILSIGISRIYLGAHFPTDVVGGWVFGAVALALIIVFIKPSL